MSKGSFDSEAPPEQSRRAPPVGRTLRIILGLALIGYTTPVFLHIPGLLVVESLLLMLGLVCFYSLIHLVLSRQIGAFASGFGAVLAASLLVAVYVAGATRLPVLGHGAGQLAVAMFLGISLVVAGIRASAGCEVMAIPGIFFSKQNELACLIFSPLDRLERKLRKKRNL